MNEDMKAEPERHLSIINNELANIINRLKDANKKLKVSNDRALGERLKETQPVSEAKPFAGSIQEIGNQISYCHNIISDIFEELERVDSIM